MDHLVRFKSSEGRDAQHVAESLDDALAFVERLRNNEDVGDVRVFRLQPVPISFKTVYKVEIGDDHSDDVVEAPAEPTAVVAPPVEEAPLVATVAGDADSEHAPGRRLFTRS